MKEYVKIADFTGTYGVVAAYFKKKYIKRVAVYFGEVKND